MVKDVDNNTEGWRLKITSNLHNDHLNGQVLSLWHHYWKPPHSPSTPPYFSFLTCWSSTMGNQTCKFVSFLGHNFDLKLVQKERKSNLASRFSSMSSPWHNRSSQTSRLPHATLQKNVCTTTGFLSLCDLDWRSYQNVEFNGCYHHTKLKRNCECLTASQCSSCFFCFLMKSHE